MLEDPTAYGTFLVCWNDTYSSVKKVMGQLCRAQSPTTVETIGALADLTPDPNLEYRDLTIDGDGSSFLLGLTELTVPGLSEPVLVETLNLSGTGLTLAELEQLSPATASDRTCRNADVYAIRSGGGASQRCLVAWDGPAETQPGVVVGALYDSPGPGDRYCIGAPNSAGPGAVIHASGSISLTLDELTLGVTGAAPGNFGIFFVGLQQMQLPFGEGFRCTGSPIQRITPVVSLDGSGAASLLLDFDQPYGALVTPGAPGVNYQFWYRDPAGGPAGFNLSDALHVQHLP